MPLRPWSDRPAKSGEGLGEGCWLREGVLCTASPLPQLPRRPSCTLLGLIPSHGTGPETLWGSQRPWEHSPSS